MAGGEIQDKEHNTSSERIEQADKADETMEADDDDADSSEADDSENDAESDQKIAALETQVRENPYMYEKHVELITKLKQAGELERLRSTRENMSGLFPLSEDLWLTWLKDEIKLADSGTTEERDEIEKLFDRAVQDYLSVPIWLEYVQYAIGGMGKEGGLKHVRDVFERALTAAGLHVKKGSMIWEAYREFEAVILAGLMPPAGSVATKEQEEKFSQQNQRVISLFKRQLSVPLNDLAETYSEYKQWMSDVEIDSSTKTAFEKARNKLKKIKPFEEALLSSPAPHLESYHNYLRFEMKENDPIRIQCLFERAIQENCLIADLWLQYTGYIDRKLRIKSIVMSVYERAVRNCPWSSALWQKYLLAMERLRENYDTLKATVEKALLSGLPTSGDFLLLWTSYCDYLKRRIDWTTEHEAELEDFRNTTQRAIDHLTEYFGPEGDPRCSLKQYWAFIETRYCNNLEKGRELWNSIMAEGHGNEAVMWLEYLKLERCYGDSKHCRKLLQRALNSASDWPESIVETSINFEREEGTFDTYDIVLEKCEAQMKRIQERRALAAEKEALVDENKKSNRPDKKMGKKEFTGKQSQQKHSDKKTPEKNWKETKQNQQKTEVKPYKRKMGGAVDPQGTGFKVPSTTDPESSSHTSTGEPPAKKVKDEAAPPVVTHDVSKESRTVFVSNLLYSIEEERLREVFTKCGEITEVRMPLNPRGKSKGFGYVEFKNEDSVSSALRMDRESVDGRPMYVSPSVDRSKNPAHFRFSTEIEKNKLFIKGLPFTCSKDAIHKIYSQYGAVKSVRLVTHKSGAPKGLAYVEFENESDASQALLKTDELQIGDNVINVSISNPPDRRAPLKSRTEAFVPSLGGGKKESESRGKARTQVSLVPRAVQKKPQPGSSSGKKPVVAMETPGEDSADQSETKTPENTSTAKMSNNDFRSMLLNK